MARILAYTSPARGHLYPLTPVLLELARRGHDVTVLTLADQGELLRGLGIDARPIDSRIEAMPHVDYRARTVRGRLAATVKVFMERAPHDADDLRMALAEIQPDVALIDINSFGAQAAAEAWGGPWAGFCPYPLPLPSVDAPPFGPGFAPARGPLGHARDRVLRPLVTGAYDSAMRPAINQVRAAAGLPALRRVEEIFTRIPMLLYFTAEPFEYPRSDWPANVVMVGPNAWEPPATTPDWLDEDDRPIVLVTSSSEFQDDGRLVTTALEALRDEAELQVIATVPAGSPREFNPPANARVEQFVPHGALLDRTTCVVTHAGMGATQKALAHGVPVCAVPFGRDQPEVARRVEVARAGTRLPARRLNPDRLRRSIREAMGRAEGAHAIAAAFSAAGGAPAAADALESRLRVVTPVSSSGRDRALPR